MLSDQLRQAIRDSGLSLYRIAKDAGVPYSAVQDFATNEDRDIGLRYAGPIAVVLGLSLQPDAKAGKLAKATKAKARSKPKSKAPAKPRRSPVVSRIGRFVDQFGVRQDVGGVLSQLPRRHPKRQAIATMLWQSRNEAGMRAWRRRGEYR